MDVTIVQIGASWVKNSKELVDWLNKNTGKYKGHTDTGTGITYTGENWTAKLRLLGAGWLMDVSFNDPKDATFFTLRWK